MENRSKLFSYAEGSRFRNLSHEEIFREIKFMNWWEGNQSESGHGSTLEQTREIKSALPNIFKKFNIVKVLDAPCGDFHWMRHVEKEGIFYTGGDVVQELIDQNRVFESENIKFCKMNLMYDPLMDFDLLFCRDCLVHFSFQDIKKVLRNLCTGNIRYLMTTTFPGEMLNEDIDTGGWRPLNLTKSPFNFPEPKLMFNEKCTEANGLFKDKSLGLWCIADLTPR